VDGKQICVLHVQRRDSPAGHFYLLVARRSTEVLLVDVGSRHDWVPIEEFKGRFAKSFTGYCLFVSRPAIDANYPVPETSRVDRVVNQ